MGFLYGWAVRGSVGVSLFLGNACCQFSMDKRHGTSVIVWSDLHGGRLPDFVIHSQGIQTRTKDNRPVIVWRQ